MDLTLILENKEALIKKFNSLNNWQEKLDFWETILKIDFIEYYTEELERNPVIELYPFEIQADKEDWFEFNNSIIERYKDYILRRRKENKKVEHGNYIEEQFEKRFYDFESLIQKLNYKIEKSRGLELTIIDELKILDDAIDKAKSSDTSLLKFSFWADYETFSNYLIYKQVPDFAKINPSVYYTSLVHNGYNLAKYYLYLQQELKKSIEDKKEEETDKEDKLTTEQQFLLLDYLGILDKLDIISTDTKKAELIALLLRRDTQSIRQLLTKRNTLKYASTKADKSKIKQKLVKISSVFENAGLKSYQNKVQADIKKLE